MFKQKISISINSQFDKDKLFDEFAFLLGNLRKTGQIVGAYEAPFVQEVELIAYQTTLEKTSLNKKYRDEYVVERMKNLEQWCKAKLKSEVIGNVVPFDEPVCNCKRHDFFILFTHAFNETGAVDCGNCKGVVPIYKLTNLTPHDRYELHSWEQNYKSCDFLQLGCTVGEKWATKQMSDINSTLSRQGRKICNTLTELTGIATYYYVFNYRNITSKKDKERQCPSCNGSWLLKDRLLNFYDFKCDTCKLISSFSPITT